MILDRENHVFSGVAIAGTGNLLSTDTIDLGVARNIGVGEDLYFYFSLNTAAPAGGTSIEFQIIVADDAALTTNVTVVSSTGAIALAQLPLNFITFLEAARAAANGTGRRYMGVRLVRTGTFTGAATVSSGIVASPTDFNQYYATKYLVS